MKRIISILIIILMLLSSTPLFFSSPAKAMIDGGGDTGPTPGHYEVYDPLRKYVPGTEIREDWVGFINNDAYESGIIKEPYKFFASIWGGYSNQRVAVSFFLAYAHVYAGQVDIDQNAHFTILQKKEWADSWNDENHNVHMMNVSASFLSGYLTTNGTKETGYYANASFLTSSSDFHPGIFEIDVQIFVSNEGYKTVAKIWGIFVTGEATVNDIHDAANWNADEQPYTSITLSVGEGIWHVTLWYADKSPPIYVEYGQVNTKSHPNAHIVKDFGNFSPSNPPPNPLRYNFTANDSNGVYVWIITSYWGNAMLYSYSWTVYNNKPNANPPSISVERQGTFVQGMTVHFYIKVKDNNSTKIRIWVVAWFGNNKIQMPDPTTDLIVAYFKPFETVNPGTVDYAQQLNYYGNINLNIFAEDDEGNLNITRVQYYVDKANGGGYTILPSWLQMPWDDTVHLVIFAIGIVFTLFTRNPLMRIIGLALIALSFISFDYLHSKIDSLMPHLPGVILRI